MFKNIPKSRALIYLLLIGLIPIFVALFGFISSQGHLSEMRSSLNEMRDMALIREKRQAVNMAVRNHFRDADHFYIDKYLETLNFLEPEVEGLQNLLDNKNIADDEAIRKRLEFLTGSGNTLSFSEGVVQSTPYFQEISETLVHPVEVNSNDIQKILSRIEGLDIGHYSPSPNRPQLIVLEFKLDRKSLNEKNEVMSLNMKLLKREFLK